MFALSPVFRCGRRIPSHENGSDRRSTGRRGWERWTALDEKKKIRGGHARSVDMTYRRKKVFFIITGVIILVVCAIFLALLLNIQAFKPRIEAAASGALGMEIRIKGRLGIDLFPGFGISLRNVSVQKKGADVVIVEKMKIGLKLIPLTKHEVRLSRVGLVRPVFSIVRYKNGMFNFEKPERTLMERLLTVNRISISEGKLVYADERSDARVKVDDFEGAIRNLSYGKTDGAGPFKNISFDGDVRCRTLTVNNVMLTNVVMRTAAKNGIFDINPISMDMFGGAGKGNIHVDLTGASPHYRVIAALNRFRVEELLQSLSPGKSPLKSIEGAADFSADLTATGKSAEEVKQSLSGGLSLNGEDLMLYRYDIDALIAKYERSQNFNLVDVGAYFLAGPFGPILTKSYNFGSLYEESQGGKGTIRKLVSIWNVNRGTAEAIDVALATKKYRIAMKGGLNFTHDRFDDVTVAVLDKQGCAVYSQKVHGPFRKAKIEKISILKSITGSVSNAMKDAWKFVGGGCRIFYSGSVAQPEG
ncbi:MAG TPA: AsmA family protein [Nitrospirota bacterium]